MQESVEQATAILEAMAPPTLIRELMASSTFLDDVGMFAETVYGADTVDERIERARLFTGLDLTQLPTQMLESVREDLDGVARPQASGELAESQDVARIRWVKAFRVLVVITLALLWIHFPAVFAVIDQVAMSA